MNKFRLSKTFRYASLAALAVVLITLIPQVSFWLQRGGQWQGAYALSDPDELAYSAYLNSLIQGEPRINNPDTRERPTEIGREENFLSVQFLPAYAISYVSRASGISASTAFMLMTPLLAFASSLAVFALLMQATGNNRVAAIGVLLVLLCSVIVSANPLGGQNNYAVFSFLRRYIPALPFPLFILFLLSTWHAFSKRPPAASLWAAGAGLLGAALVFSYFYLWTAAAAWLICFSTLWLWFRPDQQRQTFINTGIIGGVIGLALVPYLYLLSHRTESLETKTALTFSHAPDLFRLTEILGALILVGLVYGVWKGKLRMRDPATLFVASCAVTPFLVLNQQIITGRSLQPFHYEQFVLSYLVVLGLIIIDWLLWKLVLRRPVFAVALALVTGGSLALKSANFNAQQNLLRDEAAPILRTLEASNALRGSVLFENTLLAASAPTDSTLRVLWSPYTYVYGFVDEDEARERLFQYFYYLGVDEAQMRLRLHRGIVFKSALFGLQRVNRTLTADFNPITEKEIESEVRAYGDYARDFSNAEATQWPLSHIVVSDGDVVDFENLDRWYAREVIKKDAGYIVYRVRLRDTQVARQEN